MLCDAWYDDNDSLGIMFKRVYQPIIKLNKERFRGYHRHKARKLYMNPISNQKYRQRGRGESLYGSLTDEFGDRLKTSRINTSITRIGARVISYLVKIYIRINESLVFIRILVNY